MIENLSKGIGEALSSVMKALLELPTFTATQYYKSLEIVLAKADPSMSLGDVLRDGSMAFPSWPLVGEVRARLEAMLVEDERKDGGIDIRLPLGGLQLAGRYGRTYETTSAGSIAVEIGARYAEPQQPFDWQGMRDVKVGDLLEKVRKLANTEK